MAKPRNIPIEISAGTTKDVTFIFDDAPDLSAAQIVLTVKKHASDDVAVFAKLPNLTKSTALSTGTVVFTFIPSETLTLDARTYMYELKITIADECYVPLLGDFAIFSSIS
jgi:hypothetical protein